MNSAIMQWSSDKMYEGRLVAHSSVKDRILSDLLNLEQDEESKDADGAQADDDSVAGEPLIFIDTAGALMYEAVE